MKRVLIESPFAGHGESEGERALRTKLNVEYARRCVRDSVLRGEAPIASHLLFTQEGILRDDVPSERELGIAAGLAWQDVADYSVFYTDRGWSLGMLAALRRLCEPGVLDGGTPHLRSLSGFVLQPTVEQLQSVFHDIRGVNYTVFVAQIHSWSE